MKYISPLLGVQDMAASRRFYEEVFGLKVVVDFGANITFDAGFSLQSKESWSDYIEKPVAEIQSGGNCFELYFEQDDLDAFLRQNQARKLDRVHGVKEFPWGQRVIRIYDPDRHIVEVGESMKAVVLRLLAEGMSPEETATKTMHPLEFVQACMDGAI